MAKFKEASWNNPVVRIIDSAGKDIVRRNGRDWTIAAVARQMMSAMDYRHKLKPGYLQLLEAESRAAQGVIGTAIFGMA